MYMTTEAKPSDSVPEPLASTTLVASFSSETCQPGASFGFT